jgi:hypothetical protein
MPYAINLTLARLGGGDWVTGAVPDVFDPEWERAVRQEADRICPLLRDVIMKVGCPPGRFEV